MSHTSTERTANLLGSISLAVAERMLLRLAGGLLVGGLLLTLLASHEHPAGDDDNYPVIFAKYAKSNDWVAVHLVQFAGVLLLLGGLLVF
jgi:hypothetical protein